MWTELCGEEFMKGKCFGAVVWLFPSFSLLTLVCAFYLGMHHNQKCRFLYQHPVIRFRIVISALLLPLPAVKLLLLHFVFKSELFIIDFAISFIESMCWLSLLAYLCTLRPVNLHHEWQLYINLSFIMSFIASIANLLYIMYYDASLPVFHQYAEIYKLVIQSLFVISLVFKIQSSSSSEFRTLSAGSHESDSLLGSSSLLTYGGFHEEADPFSLDVAEEGGIMSKIFLWWVKPLMKKGNVGRLQTANDLFDLPDSLHASAVYSQFHLANRLSKQSAVNCSEEKTDNWVPISLFKSFHRCFGVEYYSFGLLKLSADAFSFVGPVILNLLVSFLETGKRNELGYYYAIALFATTIAGALCSTHYNYLVNRVGLKFRASLICAIYHKALDVNRTALSRFNTGEILNFMSTDVDRIVNFCQSFHQFWSLPIQVAIALYLLYSLIGYSFFVGLAFAILMVPLNHYIAKKIGNFSTLMMKEKDKRIKMMSEVLNGMKVVKMHAWEEAFSKKINSIRQREMKFLKKRKYLDAFCVYFWATTPVIISFLSFSVYAWQGYELTASRIFTSVTLFNILIIPLNAFPWVLNGLVEAYISLRRVEAFLRLPELNLLKYYTEPTEETTKLQISDAVFNYALPSSDCDNSSLPGDQRIEAFHLGPVNLTVQKGSFLCIVGKVGYGKSTLLCSVIGDVFRQSGTVCVPSADWSFGIALVPQEPWIQQTTIRENILFGKPMNTLKYRSVLEACALFDDLKILPLGDQTEVGEKGITLSGGQRARIALARAAYQDVDLYLLDDPLAAVDAHVAEHIFNYCILGLLKNKTRILCTHRVKVVEKADIVVVLEEGRIAKQGPPSIISSLNMASYEEETKEDALELDHEDPYIDNQLSVELFGTQEPATDEEKDSGSVKFEVCKAYWVSVGTFPAIFVLCSCFFMQASKTVSDWWLSFWISHSSENKTLSNDHLWSFAASKSSLGTAQITYYLSIYGGIAAANSIFTILRAFSFAYCGIKAATTLHNRLKTHIIKAKMRFFCITPLGRIINRFSSDVYNVDDSLPFMLNIFLAQAYALLGCLCITVYSLPFILLILVPLTLLYYTLQRYYRRSSRELKRISSITLSPIYAHFSETLSGHSTIRALAASERFKQENTMKLDANQQAMLATTAASQWLNLRLQFIGVVFVTGIAVVALLQHQYGQVDPGLVGLALSYALTVTALLNGFVTSFTETEKEMVSVERLMQYIDETPLESSEGLNEVPFAWPSHGIVTFSSVCLQYESGGPYALQFVTFETKRAEKIGVVGRTGSGKSSLIQALFRMVDIKEGQILIDGIDISTLSLKVLRSHLSVVPQDPFLFSGTIRENLDPNGYHADADIWRALLNCHVDQRIQDCGGLEAQVEERGSNFSAGERQLLCLARSLLHKAKVLFLDEATASIDHQTDVLLQMAIRMAFRHTTIFIIAHRIETVMNCDRVMVMGEGKVLEMDRPSVLLSNPSSEFYKLVYAVK